VDVVTGLIKANFPARISFAVASSMDSRVILDQVGAESLLGRGDMLFLNPEAGHPTRLQGCFVSDKEVEILISWWKKEIENEKRKRQAEHPEAEEPAEEEYVANRKPELETPWDTTVAEMAAERVMNGGGKNSGGDAQNDDEDNDDELIKRALDIIKNSGKVSTSLLQRKLRIGYPRAARLMEELQEMGYVGTASHQAGKARDVNRELDEE
jgi:S-DNA-T family DNA segregation ATPase FtsK/SpoIIIE